MIKSNYFSRLYYIQLLYTDVFDPYPYLFKYYIIQVAITTDGTHYILSHLRDTTATCVVGLDTAVHNVIILYYANAFTLIFRLGAISP